MIYKHMKIFHPNDQSNLNKTNRTYHIAYLFGIINIIKYSKYNSNIYIYYFNYIMKGFIINQRSLLLL